MSKKRFDNAIKSISEDSYQQVKHEKLKISFKYIDWESADFFIHGLSKKYYQLLFEAFDAIQMATVYEIKEQTHQRLNPKFINWKGDSTITQSSFPDKIKNSLIPQCGNDENELQKQFEAMTRDSFELRVAKNYGRIHGFIFDTTFHIVWFDPGHNLFPGSNQGKANKTKLPEEIGKVKPFCPEEFNRLKDKNISLYNQNQELIQENKELIELLDKKTLPGT
ncbi:hypothetical protein VB711_17845 [Cronbergia sp. UHCC 0137]|uniref:hypothetical protein n=1 Tax=Cronbergia sp. UHCC 0137 TaxID=3110239 RepID=UPI002B1EE388|nr:hypothetical protein [Cronbergia sp. UHCC 0137]MEA5619688.1 hypothetical protein [Cronbergia sp. UHCC 0137]